MDIGKEILGIVNSHNDIMKVGLRHGEEIALSKLSRAIGRMLDATGVSGDYNRGFRSALGCVQAYIQSEMKP